MRVITILLAAVLCASCDDIEPAKGRAISFQPLAMEPSTAIQASIFPGTVRFTPLAGFACPGFNAFTTAFDLVIVPTSGDLLFLDRVTFRLLDGSGIGGQAVTIPRAELHTMFGSTRVAGRRGFPFRPQFGCGAIRPLWVVGDVILEDGKGGMRRVEARARF